MESNKTFWTVWYLVCTHACLAKHLQSPGHPAAAVEHFFPCVQVFGDYYHFRHHAVEKRALSGHRGMHVRLHKEPQVRALSASHSTLQLAAAKIQKTDCIREKNVNIKTEGKKIFRCHWQLVKLWTLLQLHRFFNLPPLSSIWGATSLHICKLNNCKWNKGWECLVCHFLIFLLPF